MVRETRHLWVGNLPDNIREERIREHFKRYGRVQNVKLLGRAEAASAGASGIAVGGGCGICATVAFMDIKSASKAHNAEHVLDERTLTTEYYEPAAIPSAAGAPSAGSSPAGSGYSGSSSSVNSTPVPAPATRYHLSGSEESTSATCAIVASAAASVTWRGTNDSATEFCRRGNTPAAYGRYQRNNSTTPFATTPPNNVDRSTTHQRWFPNNTTPGATGGESTPSTPGGVEPRRRRASGSASSRSGSSSPDPSDTSRASTPAISANHHANHRSNNLNSHHHQWASTASGRPLAICVRNLPTRSTDSSLKDGLYHEYKKHGKVVWVKVVGQNADRYAVVRFKKPSDVEKALEESQDKHFFGCKISVAPHQSCDEDAESAKPYETDIDEYHPKATRTLFIGNLEKDVTQQQLREKFKHFGRIIEIDIKKGSGGGAGYAFCQYASISSVVEAIRSMDGEYVGGSRVKLGFGKPVATTCVWVDGLTEHTEKQVLAAVSRCGGAVSVCVDRAAGAALVHFEQAAAAGACVRELRRVAALVSSAEPDHPRLAVDYASRDTQEAFYEQLEKHGGSAALTGSERLTGDVTTRYMPTTRHEPISRYETSRSRASSYSRASARTPRYSSVEHYDPTEYAADRRYRVYDELGSSPQPDEPVYEERLQSVVVSPHRARRHRRDSSPEDRKHSKERHGRVGCRSRSGSLGGSHAARRRHRRRHDGSEARDGRGATPPRDGRGTTPLRDGRGATPLRDEPPAEPRRPPKERPALPMSLPLPKFAAQLKRAAPPVTRVAPAPAPASPPRAPSASSSSEGSAPHSPSLEERIRSLDEKYERWNGTRTLADAPDRARLRHRLLEVDINEVKPSEVVLSLLAKRSVFDEDSERLEGWARAPSPGGSPRGPLPPALSDPRLLRDPRRRLDSDPRRSIDEVPTSTEDKSPLPMTLRDEEHTERCKSSDDDQVPVKPAEPAPEVKSTPLEERDSDREGANSESACEKRSSTSDDCSFKSDYSSKFDKLDTPQDEIKPHLDSENKLSLNFHLETEDEKCKFITIQNNIKKELLEFELQQNHLALINSLKSKEMSEISQEIIKNNEKNGKERLNQNIVIEALHNCHQHIKQEKENIEKDKYSNNLHYANEKKEEKYFEDRIKTDKPKYQKERSEREKHDSEKDKSKNNKLDKSSDKYEKDKKVKEDGASDKHNHEKHDKIKIENERSHKDKHDRDFEKLKQAEEKSSRHEHHKKDKNEKRRECIEIDFLSSKPKNDKHKHERPKKEIDSKRECKKEADGVKSRKSSRDESSRELCRKDSTDSTASRASHESSKQKDVNGMDVKEEVKLKSKTSDLTKQIDKEVSKSIENMKSEEKIKVKVEIKEESLHPTETIPKVKPDPTESSLKHKIEGTEKQRHYSVDSPCLDSKRKERLNSCSSLPSHIGHKRRMSSQDTFDSFNDDHKKLKNEQKCHDRRDSKDSRSNERHKTTKFNKGHFAKIIESKTKDDKKNQVKPPDDTLNEWKDNGKEQKSFNKMKHSKKSPKEEIDEKLNTDTPEISERSQNDLDFLALFELRSSEEDERQKALRKEMKEKKRIQQLQQIQELQLQQEQAEFNKTKEDKKPKSEEKRKEAAREKRMSTDRKSKDEKSDNCKRKNRKHLQSTDSSDSDEPRKHSIFDIIDDGPTYISMYDKVKARSCKNMQKQEEEKRQEKIKAKFSQLKQCRAKREEKKRSSWDEDSDSDNEERKQKTSTNSSSDDDQSTSHERKREKINLNNIDYEDSKSIGFTQFYSSSYNEEDSRNKLSRKNSRTRIISDTSDDEACKRSVSKSPMFNRKDLTIDSDVLRTGKDEDINKDLKADRIKKNSLLNLFGKSDSDDSKLKSSLENEEYQSSFTKHTSNDLSSGSECMSSNRHISETRRKHKKKQRKHKFSFSDEEPKYNNCENFDIEKSKHSIKSRRHSTKKDRRKEKTRDSIDTDDNREEKNKSKKNKKGYDLSAEICSNNVKKEGKMEDIFGPLSDESDKESKIKQEKDNAHDFEIIKNSKNECLDILNEQTKLKEIEEKRKRDKKRKEKRHLIKDDENSLDVDAVSKAIEARLFAESLTDDEVPASENFDEICDEKRSEVLTDPSDKSLDKTKRECKEKRKKKKRSKEDRQNRKDLYHSHDKCEPYSSTKNTIFDFTSKALFLDIPLPSDPPPVSSSDTLNIAKESPSLPRLTDSPQLLSEKIKEHNNANIIDSDTPDQLTIDDSMEMDCDPKTVQIVTDIPMPPEETTIVKDCSEIPLPKDSSPPRSESNKIETFMTAFTNTEGSENAVRSISNLKNELEKPKSINKDVHSCKIEDKPEEKPRAIISQEETADAVAALLGESFGGKIDTFDFEEEEKNPTHEVEIESSVSENTNILEEDAEEMRRAVQNLNASELEIKPDTPVSDTDLLLIDTDTEEADEASPDAIERLPVNIIATNQSLNQNTTEVPSTVTSKAVPSSVEILSLGSKDTNVKRNETEKPPAVKTDTLKQVTSTATPVITSWTLTSNKMLEPRLLNIKTNNAPIRDSNDNKPTHITANIVQIRPTQNQNVPLSNSPRPVLTANRVSAPFQVINQMIHPQNPNMQAPTIKIPAESHFLYQKPQGIVISPRLPNDPRLQSPKTNQQGDGIISPRLSNMTILSPTPQNHVGMPSPNTLQRSPSQVTVVRMQQPPLSPIQTMHLPHAARTMVSPNRPNSVLVQTQGTPIHFNRLPVTPVLAPISKQVPTNAIVQQNKTIGVSGMPIIHHQKVLTNERKLDPRGSLDVIGENTKIILSPTNLQHSTNPTVMAQNRLLSMQGMHVGTINSNLQLSNKVVMTSGNQLNDKRDCHVIKSDSRISFPSTPIIRVAGVSHSPASSIIQAGAKSVMCTVQDSNTMNRGQSQNVIHTLNSQRLLTTAPLSNVIHIDSNKAPPSVLSMSTIRSPTVLAKIDSSNSTAVTTTSLTNVVMTPLLLKTSTTQEPVKLNLKNEPETKENSSPVVYQNHLPREKEEKQDKSVLPKLSTVIYEPMNQTIQTSSDQNTKCETDFEELLKDNTNEIKVTNNPEKKLEVNVGNTVTLYNTITKAPERKTTIEQFKKEDLTAPILTSPTPFSTSPGKTETKDSVKESLNINEMPGFSKPIEKIPELKTTIHILNEKSIENIFGIIEKPKEQADNITRLNENNFQDLLVENNDSHLKNLDENDAWSAQDVNIESVIKKVDYLCNENTESNETKDDEMQLDMDVNTSTEMSSETEINKSIETDSENTEQNHQTNVEKSTLGKRGGRSVRGKRNEKGQDRVQTRQISKPTRGGGVTKRGRGGRVKVDKKMKNAVMNSVTNIPGDVYDFHEDSGDEVATSPNKAEHRPRLILTIKSPVSGQSNVIATSSLSITPKDQVKNNEKLPKDDKLDDFVSPSNNTRKSRRLQEKDVQRSTVDDVIEDVVKGSGISGKTKEANKKRPARQSTTKVAEKALSDTRKSPRGAKRTRDRSLSDASVDSSDEKIARTNEVRDPKVPKLTESVPATSKTETDVTLVRTVPQNLIPTVTKPTPTPVTSYSVQQQSNPPTVISSTSSISSPAPTTSLGTINQPVVVSRQTMSTFASTANAAALPPSTPTSTAPTNPTPIMKPPKKMISEISAKLASAFSAAAAGEQAAEASTEVEAGRGGPVGAAEARGQSPALPHRPPAAAAAPRYAGPASLPRGAHHPPHPRPKQVAVVSPHHLQHPGTARVTITSVPSVSPQGQLGLSSDLVRSPPPAHQHTSPVTPGEGMYPHFSHQHYQMYQQHFRATQHDSRATPPYTRSSDAEGSEAPTPPLELRRPPSARVPRPAHSPSPADRLIMYAVGCGRSPPPAHGTSRLAGALPPLQAPGPPHASQVPREADSLQMLLQRYPVMWQGLLALKNDSAAVQMHFVGGNPGVAGDTLPRHTDGSAPPLRVAQRMRLEPAQLDQVHRKMKLENEHCILLALPCGRDHMDVLQQSTNLTAGFITYLQRKQAAGIVNVAPPGHHQAMFTVHIFPSCDFANENLNRIAPDLMHRVADIAHLLIVIATV